MPRLKTIDPWARLEGIPMDNRTGDAFNAFDEQADPLAEKIPFAASKRSIASPSIYSTQKLA
jgi:hypothetical protein